MPMFEYVGVTTNGKTSKGSLDAENPRAARQKLRSQGIFPTDVKEVLSGGTKARTSGKRLFESNRVSLREVSVGTRQLSTLVGAGLPLVNALQALSEQTDSIVFRRVIVNIRELVEQGSSLAAAIAQFPETFPRLYMSMVASGEASGTLDTVLANLAEYLEAQLELRRKVWSALAYPILMLFICTAVVSALLVFVVPRIVDIFQKQGAVLPLPTRVMIGLSHFLVSYWWLLIATVVLFVWGTRRYYRTEKGRDRLDRLMLSLPIYKTLFVKISTARVARTLGTLLSGGVGLLTGLEIVRNIVTNVHIARALDEAREGVREGRSLARELGKSGIFASLLSQMIAVGEKSGELEGMLEKAGRSYESEVNATLSGLTSLLEPLLMVFVGGVVLIIVISVLLPMADLITVIQR